MPRAAAALANQDARAADGRPPRRDDLEKQLADLNRQVRPRNLRPGRTHLVLVAIAIAAAWLVIVFANTLGEVDRATARREAVAAESAALEQQLAAERRELALVQTDGFQALQARAYGMGAPGERVFSLSAGAPSPEPIIPLGQQAPVSSASSPLDAWLELLFSR